VCIEKVTLYRFDSCGGGSLGAVCVKFNRVPTAVRLAGDLKQSSPGTGARIDNTGGLAAKHEHFADFVPFARG
jgi:hypothetical protein